MLQWPIFPPINFWNQPISWLADFFNEKYFYRSIFYHQSIFPSVDFPNCRFFHRLIFLSADFSIALFYCPIYLETNLRGCLQLWDSPITKLNWHSSKWLKTFVYYRCLGQWRRTWWKMSSWIRFRFFSNQLVVSLWNWSYSLTNSTLLQHCATCSTFFFSFAIFFKLIFKASNTEISARTWT